MAPDGSRPDRGRPRHRWSWFADKASATKITLWVGVATVIVGLLGAGATMIGSMTPVAKSPPGALPGSSPTTLASTGPVTSPATPSPSQTLTPRKPLTSIPRDLLKYRRDVDLDPCPGTPTCWNDHGAGGFVDVAPFSIIQCPPFNLRDVSFLDGRTLQGPAPGGSYWETVIVYPSKDAAAKVMDNLRRAIDGCPSHPANDGTGRTIRRNKISQTVGDESMWTGLQWYDASNIPVAGGSRSQVTRRGSVLVVYTFISSSYASPPRSPDFTRVEGDTNWILPKLCVFAPVC